MREAGFQGHSEVVGPSNRKEGEDGEKERPHLRQRSRSSVVGI